MARCTPTTKSCSQIESLLGCRWSQHVSTVANDIHTHRITGCVASEKEALKEKIRRIGGKYIRFYNAVQSPHVYCCFALPITREELEAKAAREAEQRRHDEVIASTKRDVKMLAEALGCRSDDRKLDNLSMHLCEGAVDRTKIATAYLAPPCQPISRDEMRVYDIIRKAQESDSLTFCVANANWIKMCSLAAQMNNKIKDEAKRRARHDACIRYGLLGIARHFTRHTI